MPRQLLCVPFVGFQYLLHGFGFRGFGGTLESWKVGPKLKEKVML